MGVSDRIDLSFPMLPVASRQPTMGLFPPTLYLLHRPSVFLRPRIPQLSRYATPQLGSRWCAVAALAAGGAKFRSWRWWGPTFLLGRPVADENIENSSRQKMTGRACTWFVCWCANDTFGLAPLLSYFGLGVCCISGPFGQKPQTNFTIQDAPWLSHIVCFGPLLEPAATKGSPCERRHLKREPFGFGRFRRRSKQRQLHEMIMMKPRAATAPSPSAVSSGPGGASRRARPTI